MQRGLNKVQLIGFFIKELDNGVKVAHFSIATSEIWTDKSRGF